MNAAENAAKQLATAGYVRVPALKNDQRYVPYWQRWEGEGGAYDWYEFPHDLPIELVWEVILDVKLHPPAFLAERHDNI